MATKRFYIRLDWIARRPFIGTLCVASRHIYQPYVQCNFIQMLIFDLQKSKRTYTSYKGNLKLF